MIAWSRHAPRLVARLGVVLACVAVWYLTLAPSMIGGPLSLVLVRGTSMVPTYATGDLVVGYRSAEPRPGQVVVFRGPGSTPVIHRLVEIDGERVVTRGDNIPADDPWDTKIDDIMGTARLHVPRVGPVLWTLARPPVLGLFAALTVTFLMLGRRTGEVRDPDPSSAPTDPEEPRILFLAAGTPATVRQSRSAIPTMVSVLVLALVAGGLVLGRAASLAVTADQLTAVSIPAPFDTYVVTPGGGNGGGNGGRGNRP